MEIVPHLLTIDQKRPVSNKVNDVRFIAWLENLTN